MALARTAVSLLAGALLCAACGSDSSPSFPNDSLELEGGLVFEPSPGAVRDRDSDRPRAWLSVPTASVVFRSGAEDPAEQNVRVSNVPPAATLQLESATYRSGDDRQGCSDPPNGSVECPGTDPLCEVGDSRRTPGSDTTAILTVDLPPCAELEFSYDWVVDQASPFRVAVAGATENLDRLGRRIDRVSGEVQMALLTGDYAESPDGEGIRALATALENREVPIVVTPGEEEVSGNSRRAYRRRFGTLQPQWRVGGVQFLGFPSPRQSLGTEGVEELDSRLRRLERDAPIVTLTHTAPLDPNELRNDGFRSRTEASRTISSLATHRADLLVAGHLPDQQRTSYGDVELVVPPPLENGEMLVLRLQSRTAGAGQKLDVTVETP